MRCLVTGGAGFIGSNLVSALLSQNHTVFNIDILTYAASEQTLLNFSGNSNYFFSKTDITDRVAVEEILNAFRPEIIFHLAAESHVDRSIDSSFPFLSTNILGTHCLIEVALKFWESLKGKDKLGFRFLHVSTDEVYGELSAQDLPFDENNQYKPNSPYSASKAASDHLVRAWSSTYGLPVIVTNCSNNYGPYQFPEKLIPRMIINAIKQEPLTVYGDGSHIRDWLHVNDHVNALIAIAFSSRPHETYCVGGSCEKTNLSLVESIVDLLDELCPPEGSVRSYRELITFVPDRPGHDFRYAINSSKLTKELGWRPRCGFETGLKQTINWYLENSVWWENILNGSYENKRIGLRK